MKRLFTLIIFAIALQACKNKTEKHETAEPKKAAESKPLEKIADNILETKNGHL